MGIGDRLRNVFRRGDAGKGNRIGLALGGGGAKGLAHIPLLELLDEMEVRPCCISGTSIGAVIGALYASGMSGSEIRELVDDTVVQKGDPPEKFLKNLKKVIGFMDLDFLGSGLFKGSSFMDYFYEAIRTDSFRDLEIPLKVVATDFWSSERVVISSGELIPAVKASMGLPGFFTPVEDEGKVLIDGGGVDPVPWDVLEDCDAVIAIDVLGSSSSDSGEQPTAMGAVMQMFDIMQRSIVRRTMEVSRPDIYIRPDIQGVGLLEFHRARDIYAFGEASRKELEEGLRKMGF